MTKNSGVLRVSLALLACLILTLPDPAWARAGGGRSMGSRGARTYSAPSYSAQPIQRSAQPRQQYNPNPQSQAQPGFAPQQPQPVFSQPSSGHSFWGGLAGGFLGMSAANMLFGHSGLGGGYGAGYAPGMGYPGGGMAGSGSAIGSLLQWVFFGGLIWFGWRMFRRLTGGATNPLASMFGGGMGNARNMNFATPIGSSALGYGGAANNAETPLSITAADQAAIGAILPKIQAAWSSGDLDKLRQFVTLEMVKYFSDALAANSSRGLANKVEQVQLQKAEVLESWAEADMEYATARLRWQAVDYMVRMDNHQIAEGSDSKLEDAEEVWTLARTRGGNWLLSAIQQAA